MKKIVLIFGFVMPILATSQSVVTFEDLSVPAKGYWNGSDWTGKFKSGNLEFNNTYDTTWGEYWTGFAYSRVTNDTSPGYQNQYASYAGGGYQSATYAVGYEEAVIRFTGADAGKSADGFYVTNGTYPALSMLYGDGFSKKFGGVNGDDPDYFVLLMMIYSGGNYRVDSVFLADFRFADNSKDYIQKDWRWVDLSDKGNIDSILFDFFSTDTAGGFINTPAYFCIDNITTKGTFSGIVSPSNRLSVGVFPNPASDFIQFNGIPANGWIHATVNTITGEQVMTTQLMGEQKLSVESLPPGCYFIDLKSENGHWTARFIKP